VHACVEDHHRSREYISFLKRLDAAYPTDTAIKLILDNHSAHISKETNAWLAAQPEGRFSFVLTPKHALWLNLVEGLLSKMARSMLRHIRVASARVHLREVPVPTVMHETTAGPNVHKAIIVARVRIMSEGKIYRERRTSETSTAGLEPKSGSSIVAVLGRIGGTCRDEDTKTEHC
jgi:hypothetical protein